MSLDLTTNIAGLILKNPIVSCSGTFGIGVEYAQFTDVSKLGAITCKGISHDAWEGNPPPRIAETPSGMLNSIGLQNKGVEHFIEKQLKKYPAQEVPLIVNVLGHSTREYGDVIERLEEAPGIAAYEVNISCPNLDVGGAAFGTEPAQASEVVRTCAHARKNTKRPLIVKLTPNVTDIKLIAQAVEEAGADALSLINTVLGMAIDARSQKAILARKVGGLSGPAIKPIALRAVYEVAGSTTLPIIGMGGVRSGIDVAEFMLAGASAVGVGSASFTDPQASTRILDEFIEYCESQKIANMKDLIGKLR